MIRGVAVAALFVISAAPFGSTAGASLTATSGDGAPLAVTPPMGWNDWARYGCSTDTPRPGDVGPSEQLILNQARALVATGLAAKGYTTVTIDGCWMASSRDANGNLVADPSRFTDGMAYVGQQIHGLGLKFGIYEDAGTLTCGGYPGSWGYYQQDASQFASWGVDYLKFDGCYVPSVTGQTTEQTYLQAYSQMSQALKNTGRDIVFSESAPSYFRKTPDWYTVLGWVGQYGHLWRDGPDVAMHVTTSASRWASVMTNYDNNSRLVRYASPGSWNDADFLIAGDAGLTGDESKSQVALWAMMAAPMILSSDVSSLAQDAISVLGNSDVVAVDQDSLGQQGSVVSQNGIVDVLDKPLANGDHAVALLNRGSSATTATTTTSAVGLVGGSACSYTVKDLWTGTVSTTTGTISATVPLHGVAIFRVTPAAGCGTTQPAGQILGDVGKCVDDLHRSTANGNPIVLSGCTGALNQHWSVRGDGTLRVFGKCLDIPGGSTTGGTKIDLYQCNGSAAQQWQYQPNGNLINPQSGLCLDDPGGVSRDGTQLQILPCGTNQREQTWSVPAPVTRQIVGQGGNCVDDLHSATANGNPIVVSTCTGALNQHWIVRGDGTLRVLGKCLDIPGASTTGGAKIDLYQCNRSAAQQWQYQPNGNLINPQSGLCLDDPGSGAIDGTQLQILPCGTNQLNLTWYLPA